MHRFNESRLRQAGSLACIALSAMVLQQSTLAADAQPAAAEAVLERIDVHPAEVRLDSPRRGMHLVVTGHYADGTVRDLTREAVLASTNDQIVTLDGIVASPIADGEAAVVVQVEDHQMSVAVQVTSQATPDPVSFEYGALVALSKQGCNSGACHGSPSGKNGFRLSLRAYDPALDAKTLVHEEFNRRTNVLEPARSLLLRKPTMDIAHGGGLKMRSSDAAYGLLHDWIAEGCRLDGPDAARCVRLEVFPESRVLHAPARGQQMLVLAHFSDGSVRDVTDLAVFTSSDEAVATVDESGLVAGQQRGEAAVLVRYLEHMETSHLMFLEDVEGFEWSNPPQNNFIDHHVFAKLQTMQILPSELAADEEFLRRVYLDVVGRLPTVAEVEAFRGDDDPTKRSRLIDALLDRPEYAQFWALKWGDLLRLQNKQVTARGVHKFHRWIVDAIARNMPYDQFARTLLTAEGSTFENPPANYFRTAAETDDCTETTSQLFLGIRIQCAKCHNHPFERWTQDNYYGIGAFFNRVRRKPGVEPDEMIVWVAREGEVTQPRTGERMPPWLPLTGEAHTPPEADRREAFADWLVGSENPFFARVAVNRVWGHLMGRGVVEPVDDFRDSNPPSNAELLDALAEDFVRAGYDLKHVIRTVLNSRTYQLSSRKNEFNAQDTKYFSHAATRLLTAEQLLDSICQVTSVAEKYRGLPAGTRATQLPSPDVDNAFLKVFGQPARETACQCERATDSNLSQALQLINGPLVHGKLGDEANRFRMRIEEGKSNEEIVRELYLAAFARTPSDAETSTALAHIEVASDRVTGLEDVCWALLNANEFLFQH